MAEYAKNGKDVSVLFAEQIAKVKERDDAADMTEREIEDLAYEELVSDALSKMLIDGSVVEMVANLRQKDKGLWNTFKKAVSALLEKWGLVIETYKNKTPDAKEAQWLDDAESSFKKLQKMFAEAFTDASDTYEKVGNTKKGNDNDSSGKLQARELQRKDPTRLKESDLVSLLGYAKNKLLDDDTYIPVRINTPQILIAFAKELGYKLENHPLAMRVYKARQALSNEADWDGDYKDKPHDLLPEDIIEIIFALNNASYLVFQTENDRFAEIIKFQREGSKKKAYAIVDFSDVDKNPAVMNGYKGGKYNILVTVYPSESSTELKEYLSKKCHKVVTGETMKKKGASQGSYGGNTPSLLNDTPFFIDSIPNPAEKVKAKNSTRRTAYAPAFYSKMSEVVDGIKTDKIDAAGVVNYLKGRGVKDSEIKWSGIQTWLDGKRSVTKQELQDFISRSMPQIEEIILSPTSATNPTEADDYSLEGGTNYREILFRLPDSTYSNQKMRDHWGEDAQGILISARVQDMVDVNGKKLLFIEEIQSDWHNAGKRAGYAQERSARVAEYQRKIDTLLDEYERLDEETFDSDDAYDTAADDILDRMAAVRAEYADVRDKAPQAQEAPPHDLFSKSYHEYALKSLIRMAAEGDYDSIAWTPASIQAARWSEDFAEAFRIEYDQDIPHFLKKYGKQWGTTVGTTFIDAALEDISDYVADERYIPGKQTRMEIWSMDLTDSMKSSVLQKGQALFQARSKKDNAKSSTGQSAFPQNSVELYTEDQYNDFGWASYNNVISAKERRILLSRFADFKHNRNQYPVTRWGEAVIHSTECPDVIMYVQGSIKKPIITKVVRILVEHSEDIAYIREEIISNEQERILLPYFNVEVLFGEQSIGIHETTDCITFSEYLAESTRASREETTSPASKVPNGAGNDTNIREGNSVNDNKVVKQQQRSNDPSHKKVIAQLEKENARLAADLAATKELLALQGKTTDGKMFTKTSVQSVAKRLMRQVGSHGNDAAVGANIRKRPRLHVWGIFLLYYAYLEFARSANLSSTRSVDA